jgi:crotonobetainyl-CoA:carnitine CoA-transferase CaiB-like acyl-CoA transferase
VTGDPAPGLWALLDGDPALLDRLSVSGPERVLPSVYDVTGFAAGAVAVATLAAAELLAARRGGDVAPVAVERRAASAAFVAERRFRPDGWPRPDVRDPVTRDYPTADGWIRLHTNYRAHRAAALRGLGLPPDDDPTAPRDDVAPAVAGWPGDDLEERVVAEGGCAAVQRSPAAWSVHPHGAATGGDPALERVPAPAGGAPLAPADRPLAGVRVLDLTRVIAGPVATRFLAAHGAEVLRIDPPGFEEVPGLVPEGTAGKRTAFLDLRSPGGAARLTELLGRAEVLVHGLRPGALATLGFDAAAVRAANPALVVAALDAYGWRGPWAGRRGFDSLVQMSCGITAAGAAAAGADRPVPLPAQALDHGTGYLLAAAVCRALAERQRTGAGADVRASLLGTARLLQARPDPDGPAAPSTTWADEDTEPRPTAWGPAHAVPVPGTIDGSPSRLDVEPGPLGRHEPTFAP